jgi:hypothetical protein
MSESDRRTFAVRDFAPESFCPKVRAMENAILENPLAILQAAAHFLSDQECSKSLLINRL